MVARADTENLRSEPLLSSQRARARPRRATSPGDSFATANPPGLPFASENAPFADFALTRPAGASHVADMHNRICRLRALALLAALPLMAQTATIPRTPERMESSFQAHKGDFDYLLGDWEFTAESKEWGKFSGRWSAVKLSEGQILDEFRAFGGKDNPDHVTTSLRNYNRFMEQWEL